MPQLIGDVSNGKNCTIMWNTKYFEIWYALHIILCIMKETKSKKYKLITIPNTLHLQ
jgi:hypothetical protein